MRPVQAQARFTLQRSYAYGDCSTQHAQERSDAEKPMNAPIEQTILKKLKQLPPERLAEVEDFVDFLCAREGDRALTKAAQKASEPALTKVWENADDADYDRL
jgi:acyl-CoA thioesterase